MKLFNIDCHVSVIADIKNIFESLGHQVDRWSLSGHRWVFGLEKCKSSVITESNWKQIDEKMVDDFYDAHHKELDQYDAFVCCYPPIFLKLFEKFNKPIIVVAATRYDFPVADDLRRLQWLEDSLNNNDNLILIANNAFDKAYCEKFLEREWNLIPSLCDYTGATYNPSKHQKVLFSKFAIETPSDIIHQYYLGRYSWEELYQHIGIIHFPYNVSTMSIFEQYQAGVPLWFPSLDYALQLLALKIPIFNEIVFPNSNPDRQASQFLTREWLSLSDFYNGTLQVNYFDHHSLFDGNIQPTSNKEMVVEKWKQILNTIEL